jgi:hypothetical protein
MISGKPKRIFSDALQKNKAKSKCDSAVLVMQQHKGRLRSFAEVNLHSVISAHLETIDNLILKAARV